MTDPLEQRSFGEFMCLGGIKVELGDTPFPMSLLSVTIIDYLERGYKSRLEHNHSTRCSARLRKHPRFPQKYTTNTGRLIVVADSKLPAGDRRYSVI